MQCITTPGAYALPDGSCRFVVWAPSTNQVVVHLHPPLEGRSALEAAGKGYHSGTIPDVPPGTRYTYVLDGSNELPDPASRYQPDGVHGPSEVCSSNHPWTDTQWRGIPLKDYIIYELHTGTFTAEGTFDTIIPVLPSLRDLGVTAIELMPVAQFPGHRNWGYDGAYPYAVQNSYGGPAGLKRLVDACHRHGLSAILDVVYNHFGPEGNYAADFGPYFTETHRTPWGSAINFDGPGSDEVREFFIGNALYWLEEFHFDALRLDALHAILDISPMPFLQELSDAVSDLRIRSGRFVYLIGESDLNDPRLIRKRDKGGLGIDAQWSDDFHHALHVTLTGEDKGYYADFEGSKDLACAMHQGFVYTGQYSRHRRRRHGAPPEDPAPERFVVCAQNHDQIGNRKVGDRLTTLVPFERLKLAAVCVLLSPYIPLLFMGEEYGETAPFPYFVSHSDDQLIEAVRKGRAAEFASFQWDGELPDPQSESTFHSAILNRPLAMSGHHQVLLNLYTELITLRKAIPALSCMSTASGTQRVSWSEDILSVVRNDGQQRAALLLNCSSKAKPTRLELPAGDWHVQLDTAHGRWAGPGATVRAHVKTAGDTELTLGPWSAVVLTEGRIG
ncbi:MAG: malto-oligosyltrehalose trehalohydrolase [Chloroflexota bacterium]